MEKVALEQVFPEFFGFVFSTIPPQIHFNSFITDTLQTEQLLASLNEHSPPHASYTVLVQNIVIACHLVTKLSAFCGSLSSLPCSQ